MSYSDTDALRGKVAELEELVQTLISENNATGGLLARLLRNEKVSDVPELTTSPDQLWKCQSCRHRLGTYSPVDDVLRIRVKDSVVRIHVGPGSWVRTICRDCLAENLLEYVPPDDPKKRLEALRSVIGSLAVDAVDASEFLLLPPGA